MEFWLRYGRTEVPVAVPDENLLGFLSPAQDLTNQNLNEGISTASNLRIGQQELLETAKQTRKTVIAFDGNSAGSKIAANLLARQMSQAGATDVLLLQAADDPTQPPASQATIEDGPDTSVPLQKHDRKSSPVAKIGEVDGTEILVSETFATAELKCTVSNVGVNSFWGYSGGTSLILPGLVSASTVKACLGFTLKGARLPGVFSENPTHDKLLAVSRMARVDFAIHLVETPDGKVGGVFFGDFAQTLQQASVLAAKIFRPTVRRRADIVIASAGGTPWDRTLFNICPSAITASTISKDHGILVLVAECAKGLGQLPSTELGLRRSGEQKTRTRRGFTLEHLVEHSMQRLCADHRVYLVSTLPEHQTSLYNLLSAKSVGSALQRAIRHAGKDAMVAMMSHGCLTAPVVE